MRDNQVGFVQLIIVGVIVVILVGVAGGYFFLKRPTSEVIEQPQNTEDTKVAQKNEISHEVELKLDIDNSVDLNKLKAGDTFIVSVILQSKSTLNLFSAHLNYAKELVKAKEIKDVDPETVELWVEKKIDGESGEVRLAGGTPIQGFKVDAKGSVTVSRIEFEVIADKLPDSFKIDAKEVQLFKSDSKAVEDIKVLPLTLKKNVLGTTSDGALKFSAENVTVGVGCTFDQTVNLETGEHQVDGTDVVIKYDPAYLTPMNLSEGSIASDPDVFRMIVKSNYVYFSVIPLISSDTLSNGSLGKISFKTLKATGPEGTELSFKFNASDLQNTTDANIVERKTIKDVLGTVNTSNVRIASDKECSATSYKAVPTEASSSAKIATSSAVVSSKYEGDANGDGKLDLSDVSALFMNYSKTKVATSSSELKSDLNDDGKVNVLDFAIIVRNMFKKGILKL